MFEGIRPKAVLLGIAADLGATVLAMIMMGAVLGFGAGAENLSDEEKRRLLEEAVQDPNYLLLGGLLGLLATVLGGYVAARVAEVAPLLNAACVGVFGLILGIFSLGEVPLWFAVVGLFLTPVAAIAGGVLWRRTQGT